MAKKKHWNDYLWIFSAVYLLLGFVNILFAWLGMLCFLIPLVMSIGSRHKEYCNHYCGRGQLFELLGGKFTLSRQKKMPKLLYSPAFRYGFLAFFLLMFANLIFMTWLVFTEAQSLGKAVTLFWTFKVPWHWAYVEGVVAPWVAQFSFGFYSLMLTSSLIGFVFMLIFRPRSWCVICPMGTMTQGICKLKYPKGN